MIFLGRASIAWSTFGKFSLLPELMIISSGDHEKIDISISFLFLDLILPIPIRPKSKWLLILGGLYFSKQYSGLNIFEITIKGQSTYMGIFKKPMEGY